MKTFKCIECNVEKNIENFYKKPLLKTKHDRKCKICRNIKSDDWESKPENRKLRSEYYFYRKYKITLDDVKKLKEQTNYKCTICNIEEKYLKRKLHIDHDHKTGKIRGVLCDNCNKALGSFQDSIENLLKAVDYLKKSIV